MRCEEVQSLQGLYLDSELDARTALEIEQHLKSCRECARLDAEEQKLDARLRAGLNRGQRTVALWRQVERAVADAAPVTEGLQTEARTASQIGWQAVFDAMREQVQAGWRCSRWAWTGLAMVWVVILGLRFAARDPVVPAVAGRELPPAAEVRFAVEQKHLLMADLAFTTEPAPHDKPKAAPPSPRSDRREENRNT
jgi:anti-sigma factor RsiW